MRPSKVIFDDQGLREVWREAHAYYGECNPEERERMALCEQIIDAVAELYRLDYNKPIINHQDTIEHG